MPLSVRDAGSWNTVNALWVRSGGAWEKVKALWVYSSGSWNQCFAAQNLLTFSAYVLYNDPTLGDVRFEWTAGYLTGDTVKIEANCNSAGWNTVSSTEDPSTGFLETNISGFGGFDSIQNTNFRAQLLDGGSTPIGDQINIYPSYQLI
jgi:hypothetical protein